MTERCACPCHTKGDPGQGYVYHYTDDLEIMHEDWIDCRCTHADPQTCRAEVYREGARA